jgi:hypothetical protein
LFLTLKKKDMEDLVLVLDVDGTLVSERRDDEDDRQFVPHARPHLDEFLMFVFRHFRAVGIWTAAGRQWFDIVRATVLQPILNRLGRDFDFVWTGERCQTIRLFARQKTQDWRSPSNYEEDRLYFAWRGLKPLRRMWRSTFRSRFGATRETTLIVDDTPETYCTNRGNAISIAKYRGQSDDRALRQLVPMLRSVAQLYRAAGTVRNIDKTSWRPSLRTTSSTPCILPHRTLLAPNEFLRPAKEVVRLSTLECQIESGALHRAGYVDEHRVWRLLMCALPHSTSAGLVLDYLSVTPMLVRLRLVLDKQYHWVLTRRDHSPAMLLAAIAVDQTQAQYVVCSEYGVLFVHKSLLSQKRAVAADRMLDLRPWPVNGSSLFLIRP